MQQDYGMASHRSQPLLLTNLSQTSFALFTPTPRMTIILRIQQSIMPSDHILLNRPSAKKQNIAPELTSPKSLHCNPPSANNSAIYISAPLAVPCKTADTGRNRKQKATHQPPDLQDRCHFELQNAPTRQKPATESFQLNPRQPLKALYSGLTT